MSYMLSPDRRDTGRAQRATTFLLVVFGKISIFLVAPDHVPLCLLLGRAWMGKPDARALRYDARKVDCVLY